MKKENKEEWSGLEISKGNFLYVDVKNNPEKEKLVDQFFNEVKTMSIGEMSNNDLVYPIYEHYYPLIGINSILDVFNQHFKGFF